MCSKKLLVGLLVVSVALSSPLFAWFTPKEKIEVNTTETSAPVATEQGNATGITVSEEQKQVSDDLVKATDDLEKRLLKLEESLKDSRAKESDYAADMDLVKEATKLLDSEYAELLAEYNSLKKDYEKAYKQAEKYKFATPFVQVNATMRNVLNPEWGLEGVVGARIGHATVQGGVGYTFAFDKPWNENLEVKCGVGWEF